MSNDNEIQSIHEFELQLIVEYYALVERQGPGSEEITKKALSFIENLADNSKIADLGCGTGGQTMTLAQNAPGTITGIDLFQTFIDLFNKNAEQCNLAHRVKGIQGSMDALSFEAESLDLIWSEGAIYNIGFERGLKEWRKYLKPQGYIAVSEATWFTETRPKEIEDFWNDAYPGIDTIPNKTAIMQKAGYVPVAVFNLPDSCWTEEFFKPQEKAVEIFLNKHKGNKTAEAFIANQLHEQTLFNKYSKYYGYTFYIGKKQ